MKTSKELINDLDTGGKKWAEALLVVGFPTMTKVVPSSFPERLQMLETLLQQEGIPVGMVTMQESTDGTLHFFYCVLEERIADGWAEPYMDAFVKAMAESAPGEVFSDSIGIDEFRSKISASTEMH